MKLDLSDASALKTLKREIKKKNRRKNPITSIQIECLNAEFWVCAGASLSDDDLNTLFTHIGHAFPSLKKVSMKVFELPLPVAALKTLLLLTKNTLEEIDMEDVILKGSQEELEALAGTFKVHPTLKTIKLDWCNPVSGSLEPVFQGLCNIQTLNQVKICGSVLSVASLRVLCHKKNLKRLSLCDDELKDDAITAMADALELNEDIKELSVRLCGLDPVTGIRFANVLRVNNTLEKLELRIKDSDWNSYGAAFRNALEVNDTLKTLEIFIDGLNTDVPSAVHHLINGALYKHPSLKSVHIALRGIYSPGIIQREFEGPVQAMLENNLVLEQLKIDGMDLPHQSTVLLRANRAGRQILMRNLNARDVWTSKLIEHREDIALTDYLISTNPSILLY